MQDQQVKNNANLFMKIYFHIGQFKTGTSAIQSFMNYNRDYLMNNHRILYPNMDSIDFGRGMMHNHGKVFVEAEKRKDDTNCIQKFIDCVNYARIHGVERIVLSVEGFEWGWWPALIKKIVEAIEIDYSIILYLRRQDTYLEAAWKQWGHKLTEVETIMDYSRILPLDWFKILSYWLNNIPVEKIILHPYEKLVIGDNILIDFMKILGVMDLQKFKDPPDNNFTKNRGLHEDVISMLRLCNHAENLHHHDMIDLVYNSLSDKYKKQPMQSYNLLSPVQRLEIIDRFSESNSRIAKLFGMRDGILFKEPLPDLNEKWEPQEGLSLDKAIPILMDIIKYQHQEIQKINHRLHRMEALTFKGNQIKQTNLTRHFMKYLLSFKKKFIHTESTEKSNNP